MIRIIAKLFAFAVVLTAFLPVARPFALPTNVWISSTGSDSNSCTALQPCTDFGTAILALSDPGVGQISCLNSPAPVEGGLLLSGPLSLTIDCAGLLSVASPNDGAFQFTGTNQVVKIRHLTISGTDGGYPAIKVTGSGSLILEDCVFENFSGTALDIEPTGPFSLVVTNSRISNSAAGVLIQPGSGGSVNATLDHVRITNNSGGGIKTNTTNGLVTVDITDSVISENAGNGINAVGAAGGQNMVSIKNTIIAKNGSAGVQANGANSGVLVATTLLDQNSAGATSAIGGGHISTYGNNSIVGSAGSGFTGTAPLQ
jgi:hypothetical protein